MPKPRGRPSTRDGVAVVPSDVESVGRPAESKRDHSPRSEPTETPSGPCGGGGSGVANRVTAPGVGPRHGDVIALSPNVLSVRHWDRLSGCALYAATPRLDWASLLGRSFDVDVLECPKCHGRLRVLAVITEREPVQRVLAHLGVPTEAPPLARARDPADDLDDTEAPGQGPRRPCQADRAQPHGHGQSARGHPRRALQYAAGAIFGTSR